MISRTLVSAAVAAACGMLAVSAAAQTMRSGEAYPSSHPVMVQEVITPFSVNESGPSWPMPDTRAHRAPQPTVAYVSLPNPQTPFSPNESGPVNYAQEMRERAHHVASVAQARVNVARIESERLAAIERERVEAIERERLAALERERLANAQTSPTSDATMSSAPVGGTSATAGGSSTAVTAPVESTSSISIAPAPVPVPHPAPQREAQADPSAALVDTRSMLGSGATAPQEGTVAGASPASTPSDASSSANVSVEARQHDGRAENAAVGRPSINASSTIAGGGIDGGNTPRDNAQLMLQEGNAEATPR